MSFRIDNCGGCFPEYRNMRNEIVKCRGWWTPYESKRVRKLQDSIPNIGLPVNSIPADSQNSGSPRGDMPLIQDNTNRGVAPVVPQGSSISVNNESVDKAALQRGLELVLGVAARKETTREIVNKIDKNPSPKIANVGGRKDELSSVPIIPPNSFGQGGSGPGSSSSSSPSSSMSSNPMRDSFGSSSNVPREKFSSSAKSGITKDLFGSSSSSSSSVSSSPSNNLRDRFGSKANANIPKDKSSSSAKAGFSKNLFGPSSSSPSKPSTGFSRGMFGSASKSANPKDQLVPSTNSALSSSDNGRSGSSSIIGNRNMGVPIGVSGSDQSSTLKDQPRLLDLPPPPPRGVPMRTSFRNNPPSSDSRNAHLKDQLPVNIPVANELSKKRKPKVVSDKRSPPKRTQKSLKNAVKTVVSDSKDTPFIPFSNQDPSVIDRNIVKQGIKKTPNVPTASPKTNILFVVKDTSQTQGMEPSLLDWLLQGLLGGTDFTGMPIQAMGDHQPVRK